MSMLCLHSGLAEVPCGLAGKRTSLVMLVVLGDVPRRGFLAGLLCLWLLVCTSAHGPQLACVGIQLGLLEVSMQLKATGCGSCGLMQVAALRPQSSCFGSI